MLMWCVPFSSRSGSRWPSYSRAPGGPGGMVWLDAYIWCYVTRDLQLFLRWMEHAADRGPCQAGDIENSGRESVLCEQLLLWQQELLMIPLWLQQTMVSNVTNTN